MSKIVNFRMEEEELEIVDNLIKKKMIDRSELLRSVLKYIKNEESLNKIVDLLNLNYDENFINFFLNYLENLEDNLNLSFTLENEYNDYNNYTSVFPIESIASGIFGVEPDSKELHNIMEKKLFILESNIGIKKADHNWDIMFNRSKKYITAEDREKYLNLFYNILKSNCGDYIVDLCENTATKDKKRKFKIFGKMKK